MVDRLLTTGGTCRACAADHFLSGRVKKSGYMTFPSSVIPLYDLSSVLRLSAMRDCIYLPYYSKQMIYSFHHEIVRYKQRVSS